VRAIAVIPARYASTRFPGKPLATLLGRPMIAWVVEGALGASSIETVCVATDHEGIARAAEAAGAKAVMTSAACATGTDRVAEAARRFDADVVVNLQGDEPALDPGDVDRLVAVFSGDRPPRMATLSRPAADAQEVWSPDAVKVVTDRFGDALYFSRSPLPYFREAWRGAPPGEPPPGGAGNVRIHVGIYAFERAALEAFPSLPQGELERAESLEQLRALESGWRIRVVESGARRSIGVDRPEDVARAEEALRELKSAAGGAPARSSVGGEGRR